MFMRKRSEANKVWNMSEHMRIMNCLKKYEKSDCNVLNRVFEYLNETDKLPAGITIYKVIQEANNQVTEKKFKKKSTQKAETIDLMQYL